MGISTIVPITTERTVKTGLNVKRLETIIREAAEQSGRGIVPTLAPHLTLKDALATCNPKEALFFDLSGSLPTKSEFHHAGSLFIGPEGGFTPSEVDLARKNGCTIASLGPLTLRGETAAIVGSYLVVQN